MHYKLIPVSDDFWNIRGSFRIGGLIDIGTQASLVRLANGNFVFLDSCDFPESVYRELKKITQDGRVEAIINVHPFHTLHVKRMHERFPTARLYGTRRHHDNLPDLPWEPALSESAPCHQLFAADFEFSIPAGVDFISSDEKVHFSSVLVCHPASKTLHVDDTLIYVRLPLPLRVFGMHDTLSFHPTLSRALQPVASAPEEFRQWATAMAQRWRDTENLCAAHVTPLLAKHNSGAPIYDRIILALQSVESKLDSHERRWQEY